MPIKSIFCSITGCVSNMYNIELGCVGVGGLVDGVKIFYVEQPSFVWVFIHWEENKCILQPVLQLLYDVICQSWFHSFICVTVKGLS